MKEPLEKVTVKFITIKSARGHSFKACELALAQLASKRFPLEVTTHRFAQGRGPRHQIGRRRGRAGRDPRLADAVAVGQGPIPCSRRRAGMSDKAKIAIATGDPAGIGPEISLKAALWPFATCHPIVVGDPGVIVRHAEASGLPPAIRVIERIADADWSDHRLHVLACAQPEAATLDFAHDQRGGRASAFAQAAIDAALCGDADAVVAAPQNETAIARAGIKFDGYPSFVARATGDENDAHLMLCFGGVKIVHATLHRRVRDAIDLITRERSSA